MKASLNWIRDHVDTGDLSVEEIGDILTNIGLEVEGLEHVEKIKGGLKGIVTGEVITCEQHPNADRLSITTVDVGAAEFVNIVCGAPNVAKGQKVLVATIGTTLYTTDGESWKIKKGKIRGEVSEGMICAEDELGLGESHDGIMVLDVDVKIGQPASVLFNLEMDDIYDIGLTPNRSDATGHIGIAKDLWAYLKINKDWQTPIILESLENFEVDNNKLVIAVEVEDESLCPRYSCLTVSDLKIALSPDWLQFKLNAIGVKPINNVVDITNYILHEYGQPLHAFDADKISDNKIIVKTLDRGTKFKALDEVERSLRAEDLMICNGKGEPICIAGVFGGIDSGVSDTTTKILLESAHFNAKSVRVTSMHHILRTDAAMCFEKGSDPNITVEALKHAAILLKSIAGGTISSEIVDNYPTPIAKVQINVRYRKVNQLIGDDISPENIRAIVDALEMDILDSNEEGLTIAIPTNKADVTREVDVIEEILRIYDFNKVKIPTKLSSVLSFNDNGHKQRIKQDTSAYLANNGFNEMMGLSLTSSEQSMKVLDIDRSELVFINNTSNVGLDVMRPDILVSGLESVRHNLNRRQIDIKLFEWGNSYRKASETYVETPFLSLFLTGDARLEDWREKNNLQTDFYDIKSVVESLLNRIGVASFQKTEIEDARFEYGWQYHRGPKVLLKYGKLSEEICRTLGIKQAVFSAEFNWSEIESATKKSKIVFGEISKFPTIRRDLALLMDDKVNYGDVEKTIIKSGGKLLKSVDIFDVYKSDEYLGKGKKSYAVQLIFEDLTKTLKDKDVEKLVKKALQNLEKVGVVLR